MRDLGLQAGMAALGDSSVRHPGYESSSLIINFRLETQTRQLRVSEFCDIEQPSVIAKAMLIRRERLRLVRSIDSPKSQTNYSDYLRPSVSC